MRGKNIQYVLIVVVLLALGFGIGRLSAGGLSAVGGTLDSPGPPASTYSHTLEDIYKRLDTGVVGTPITFTEPTSGPVAGTMHTLNDIMAKAPSVDNTNGATRTHVLAGKTFWGLTSGQWGLITGTRPAAPVPKTGQTISYTVGDDGALQNGVGWPSPRFITGTAGVATDALTGLIWLQDANCTQFFSGDSTGQNKRSWSNALVAANSLASGYCGLTDGSKAGDWRLPNVRELYSLIHYGVVDPGVPNTAGTGKWSAGDPFTGVQSDWYWSSTTHAGNTSNAWYVIMNDGDVYNGAKSITNYVWPVRCGQ